jgi:hypothetical protein
MKLLRVLHTLLPPVQVRPIKNLSTDLRSPKMAFKYRRWRECRKVPVARTYWPKI